MVRANSLIRAAMDAIDPFELELGRRRLTAAIPFPFHPNRVLDDGGVT